MLSLLSSLFVSRHHGKLHPHLAVVESPTASPLKEGEPGFIKGRHDLVWKEVFEDGPRPSN